MLAAQRPPLDAPTRAVDIVVNNYNYGRFLRAALDSALAQRHPAVTVTVVDDGSTDHSREVIAAYGDRVNAVFKDNGGQASALNAGWGHCRGDVVIFLDADDVLLPATAAHFAAAFETRPDVAKVQAKVLLIDAEGATIGHHPRPDELLPSGDLRRDELTFPFDIPWLPTSANAFSTAVLRRIMPIPEQEFARSADWYLKHLTPLLGSVVSLDETCACYRIHGSNNYQPVEPTLDLEHVRQTISYAATTDRYLRRLAREVGLPAPDGRIMSVADLANRLISRKLQPQAHPLPGDRVGRLALAGIIAATKRFDVRWPMKLLFIGWFAATAVAPRRMTEMLAVGFLFPRRRGPINRLLRPLVKATDESRELKAAHSAAPRAAERRLSSRCREDRLRQRRGQGD